MFKKFVLLLLAAAGATAWGAGNKIRYHVTVTNLTTGQTLSPPLLALHSPDMQVFSAGQAASEGVYMIAEDGKRSVLQAHLEASGKVQALYAAKNPIMPGRSVRYLLKADSEDAVLSFVTMLVTTNDGFTGVSGMALPARHSSEMLPAYDAGSEDNTESCAHIPGPPCGSHNVRVPQADGIIQMHPGILGVGDLTPAGFGWNGPVAKVTIKKL